jgi:hypothetical protein
MDHRLSIKMLKYAKQCSTCTVSMKVTAGEGDQSLPERFRRLVE